MYANAALKTMINANNTVEQQLQQDRIYSAGTLGLGVAPF